MKFLEAVEEMKTGKYMFMSRIGSYVDGNYVGIIYAYSEIIPGNKKLNLTYIGKNGIDNNTGIQADINDFFENDWLCYQSNKLENINES